MNSNVVFVSIEGCIGSGKSTILNQLKQVLANKPQFVFIDEPVSVWESIKDDTTGENIIQLFYRDTEKYAFSFQILACISKIVYYFNQIVSNREEPLYIIAERSLLTDKLVFAKMLFDAGKIDPTLYNIYLYVVNSFIHLFPLSKIIYVDTDVAKCKERVIERARIGEELISIEYLTECTNYHKTAFMPFPNSYIIDGNQSIETINEVHIENIVRFICR